MRTPAAGVSIIGRNTQGVTIIRTAGDEAVVGLQRIDEIQSDEDEVEFDENGEPIVAEAAAEDTEGQAPEAPEAEQE